MLERDMHRPRRARGPCVRTHGCTPPTCACKQPASVVARAAAVATAEARCGASASPIDGAHSHSPPPPHEYSRAPMYAVPGAAGCLQRRVTTTPPHPTTRQMHPCPLSFLRVAPGQRRAETCPPPPVANVLAPHTSPTQILAKCTPTALSMRVCVHARGSHHRVRVVHMHPRPCTLRSLVLS